MAITDSELYRSVEGFVAWYKELAFKGISQIPYGRVPAWKAFADGKVEETLKEDRSLWQSIKEYYVLGFVSMIAAMVAMWYLTFTIGGLLLMALGGVVLLGALLDPVITLAAVLLVVIAIALFPAICLLVNSAVMHILAKLLGGAGSFRQTVSVIVLGAGASLVLMIPMYIAYALVIGLFLSPLSYAIIIFLLYLQYRGIKHAHKLSPKRAAAVVIGSVLLFMGIYMAVVLVANIIRVLALIAELGG